MFGKKSDRPGRTQNQSETPKSAVDLRQSLAGPNTNISKRSSPKVKGAESMAPSIIGTDLVLMGNAISKGEVQVDGEVQGDIHCASLLVGEQAQVTGGIVAEDVVVRGKVMGSIRGMRVTLQSSSHVEGDIYHQSLAIEQGAFFEGKSRRAEDPMTGTQKLDVQSETTTLRSPVNGSGEVVQGAPIAP